jgi:hypothetical protein
MTPLVPLIVDDAFYDDPDVRSLPDCSVAFLMRAGSWSARNSLSGFVPSKMLAHLGSDTDKITRTLQATGRIERVKGGVRITEGHGLTVVNAADAAREQEALHSAKSAGGKRGNHERWHEKRGVRAPGCEFCEPGENRTSHTDRIPIASDSDATPRSRSDLDLSPGSKSRSKSKSARTRGPAPGSEEFRSQVIARFSDATGIAIGPETADAIAADVLGRREHVDNPLLYVFSAIANEPDPAARWLAGLDRHPAAPPAEIPWCGECGREDRRREDSHGKVYDCPECSPKSFAAWEAKAS